MTSSNSSPLRYSMHHRCCLLAHQPIVLPSLRYSQRTGIKRLFCDNESDVDANNVNIRLPRLSEICAPQPSCTECSLGRDLRINGGVLSGRDSVEPRWHWLGNTALVQAFVAEFRRRPSSTEPLCSSLLGANEAWSGA